MNIKVVDTNKFKIKKNCFRLPVTDELVSFVQIVKQAVQLCGDEIIKESQYVMHVDCTINCTRYVFELFTFVFIDTNWFETIRSIARKV